MGARMSITPKIHTAEFKQSKRYKKLEIHNYMDGKAKVLVDVDPSNRLVVFVFPPEMEMPEVAK